MMIPFTYFRCPNGTREHRDLEIDPSYDKKVQMILANNCRFEMEYLSTGQYSITIAGYDPDIEEDTDLCIKIGLLDTKENYERMMHGLIDSYFERTDGPTQQAA